MINARYYQVAAVESVIASFQTDASTLLDMATGTGKTYTFAWIIKLLGGRSLVLAHREVLISQARKKIDRVAPELGVSIDRRELRGERRTERNLFDAEPSRVVIASKDTLCQKNRLGRYRSDDFDYVVVDEAHRAVKKNSSYYAILKKFCRPPIGTGTARLLGVSASYDRADGEALAGLFQSVSYRYTLPQAVDDGFLLKPVVKRVNIKGLKVSELPRRYSPDGDRDITPAALDRIMRRREYAFGVARPLLDVADGGDRIKRGVVFSSSGPQAEMQAAVLNAEKPGCAALCLGEPYQSDAQRDGSLDRWDHGGVQFLVTCDVLTEGWDSDLVDIVVPKLSASRSRVAQMIGRGTRPLDGCVDPWPTAELRKWAIECSPKPHLVVLDPCGVSDQHSLVSIPDIFTGHYSGDTLNRPRNMHPAERPDDIEERRARRDAIRAIEESQLEGLKVAVDYDISDGDMMRPNAARAAACPKNLIAHPAQEWRCRWLEARGIPVPKDLAEYAARDLMNEIKAREAAEPATPGQRALLAKFGLPVAVTRGEASARIEQLKANGWQRETDHKAGA